MEDPEGIDRPWNIVRLSCQCSAGSRLSKGRSAGHREIKLKKGRYEKMCGNKIVKYHSQLHAEEDE